MKDKTSCEPSLQEVGAIHRYDGVYTVQCSVREYIRNGIDCTIPHTCMRGNGLFWNNLSQSSYFESNSIKSKRIELTLTCSVSKAKCFIPQKIISIIHDLQAIDTGPEEGVCTDVLSQCSVALNTAHAADWTLRRNGLCCITTLPIYPPPVVNHVSIESETGQAKLWRKAHTSHAKWLWCSSWQW